MCSGIREIFGMVCLFWVILIKLLDLLTVFSINSFLLCPCGHFEYNETIFYETNFLSFTL